jgi:hypothetical protein
VIKPRLGRDAASLKGPLLRPFVWVLQGIFAMARRP